MVFVDLSAHAVLITGRHLILINTINAFQDAFTGTFADDSDRRTAVEAVLAAAGMLERNPGRLLAATRAVPRARVAAD